MGHATGAAHWPAVEPVAICTETDTAALVVLLPGMSLTVAMTELATRNLISGTARLMSAVIVLLELVVGVALGERLAAVLVDVHHVAPASLPEWAQWVALAAASVGVAIVVQAQLRAFGWIVAACAVGYIGSRVGGAWLGIEMGVLVGALALGVTSNIYARWLDRPAQVVQVPRCSCSYLAAWDFARCRPCSTATRSPASRPCSRCSWSRSRSSRACSSPTPSCPPAGRSNPGDGVTVVRPHIALVSVTWSRAE